jgi:CHAT domain-containing protein/tetratricopeptide (TPR) repeat protein
LLERNLSIAEQSPEGEDVDTAIAVAELAILHAIQGNTYKAWELYERELAIRERVQGPESVRVAQTLNNMAIAARALGRLDECEAMNRRALAIRVKVFGPEHTEVAESYNGLGVLNWQLGDYGEAETFLRRAVAIYETAYGPEHLEVGRSKSFLGILLDTQGKYAEAEPLLLESIAITEVQLGSDHPDMARHLNNLANLYSNQLRYAEAEPLYIRAMEILEKTVGPDDLAFGESMSNLAIVYAEQGRYSESEPLDKRVIALFEKTLGPDHPYVAVSIEHLASSYKDQGRYDEAEPLYQRAISIVEKSYGVEHPDMAVDLNNLANLYMLQARYAEADSLVTRAFETSRMVFGPDNHNTAQTVESMCKLRRLQGQPEEALELAAEASRVRLANFHENALVLAEKDALSYSWNLRNAVSLYLSSYFDSGLGSSEIRREIADVVFSAKGRVSDGIFERQRALIEDSDSLALALAEDLRLTKFQLSELFIYGPEGDIEAYKTELESLRKLAHELEADLSRRSASFRKREEYRDVNAGSLASLLPETSVLVEYVKYDYYELNPERKLPRYMAVVARPGGEPVVLDIGQASDIDGVIEDYRAHMLAVAGSGSPPTVIDQEDYKRISGDLYAKVWKPLEEYLGDSDLVLIAGDGALNMISFAGLLDDEGMYLVEKHPVHYLSSGRDLIRLKDEEIGGTGLFALGDPDYDSAPASPEPVEVAAADVATGLSGFTVRSARSGHADLRGLTLAPLPGTRSEVEQIAEAWTQTTDDPVGVYLGSRASEDRFKADAPGNRVIHLATHGYFLEGVESDEGYVGENPLLLSGLFLAGVNVRDEVSGDMGAEDGILTAYEVSALDLTGTDMVVLSACETGLGKVEEGEGVYGLRRAFQMAGARTVISALWRVSDRETADLMGDLYGRVGESIPETMQRIQKSRIGAIRADDQADHPYTWAGFLALGDWK